MDEFFFNAWFSNVAGDCVGMGAFRLSFDASDDDTVTCVIESMSMCGSTPLAPFDSHEELIMEHKISAPSANGSQMRATAQPSQHPVPWKTSSRLPSIWSTLRWLRHRNQCGHQHQHSNHLGSPRPAMSPHDFWMSSHVFMDMDNVWRSLHNSHLLYQRVGAIHPDDLCIDGAALTRAVGASESQVGYYHTIQSTVAATCERYGWKIDKQETASDLSLILALALHLLRETQKCPDVHKTLVLVTGDGNEWMRPMDPSIRWCSCIWSRVAGRDALVVACTP